MLLEIFQWLSKDVRVFNVFGYITLRTVLAALTALSISFIVGPWMIRKLTALKIGQTVRNDGPQSHLVKSGTPTMGGALILVSVAVTQVSVTRRPASLFWKERGLLLQSIPPELATLASR